MKENVFIFCSVYYGSFVYIFNVLLLLLLVCVCVLEHLDDIVCHYCSESVQILLMFWFVDYECAVSFERVHYHYHYYYH